MKFSDLRSNNWLRKNGRNFFRTPPPPLETPLKPPMTPPQKGRVCSKFEAPILDFGPQGETVLPFSILFYYHFFFFRDPQSKILLRVIIRVIRVVRVVRVVRVSGPQEKIFNFFSES